MCWSTSELCSDWCGRGDLNPHAFRRHPLKMVCLPVPPLPLFEAASIIAKGVSVLYDGREGFRVEAGAAHQGSVDFFLGHQGLNVFWFYRAPVQDPQVTSK